MVTVEVGTARRSANPVTRAVLVAPDELPADATEEPADLANLLDRPTARPFPIRRCGRDPALAPGVRPPLAALRRPTTPSQAPLKDRALTVLRRLHGRVGD